MNAIVIARDARIRLINMIFGGAPEKPDAKAGDKPAMTPDLFSAMFNRG